MGRVYEGIDERQRAWIAAQPLFFVGTAPLAADGHVNVSPKGPIGSLRVLGEHRLASGVRPLEERLGDPSHCVEGSDPEPGSRTCARTGGSS